ncbi:hypothetical protein EON79_16205 [bacterium]|nr:MAG: hypothetical protein EON79_16205 [bacterium]
MSRALAAFRHNLRPFLLIQAGALAFVALFYLWPTFAAASTAAGEIKAKSGLIGAALATAFASFAVPEGAKRLTRMPGSSRADALFQIAFFMIIGVMVDVFYQLLGVVVGRGTDVATVAKKVLIDQAVASPLLFMPYSALAFAWRDFGFSFRRLRAEWWTELRRRWPAIVGMGWLFWGPVLSGIYALPSGVQFIMFLCAQAAWSLLLVWLADDRKVGT